MSVFDATSTRDAPDLVGTDSNRSEGTTQSKSLSDLEEDLDLLLKLKDMGATAWRGAPIFDIYSDSNEKDSEMREPPLVGRTPPLKTTRNPMATLNHFRAAIWV
jgi:hypothetical protein